MEFKWTEIEQDYSYKIKRIVARNNLLTYPDFNEEFKIHIDASNFQFGLVISQKGKLIYFYSIKLTDAPIRYKVTEK